MKVVPQNEPGMVFHLTTLFWASFIIVFWLIDPDLAVNPAKNKWILEHFPEAYWIWTPIICFLANMVLFFVERSLLGLLSVVSNAAWVVFGYHTFPLVMKMVETGHV